MTKKQHSKSSRARVPNRTGARVCVKCKQVRKKNDTVITPAGRLCKKGTGCQRGTCVAKKRNAVPCTYPYREIRPNGQGGTLKLCRFHALGFDTDEREHGTEYAAHRVDTGLPPD